MDTANEHELLQGSMLDFLYPTQTVYLFLDTGFGGESKEAKKNRIT